MKCDKCRVPEGKLLIISGMVIGAFAIFVGTMTAIAYGQSTNQSSEIAQKTTFENSTDNPDKAYLMIVSLAPWQASIMDSGNDFTTIDGVGTRTLEFECTPGLLSTYSVSVQKQTEEGGLSLELVQGGKIIDRGRTTAQYGIVSLSGECNKPG